VIEINGNSFILTGTYDGKALQFAPPSGKSSLQYSVEDRNDFPGGYVDFTASDGASSTSDNFITSYDYRNPPAVVPVGDLSPGSFAMVSFDQPSGQFTNSDVLSWQNDAVSFSVLSSVPEPAQWALMLAGLAGAGAAARFRRRGSGAPMPERG
jgi:hypothetical protein